MLRAFAFLSLVLPAFVLPATPVLAEPLKHSIETKQFKVFGRDFKLVERKNSREQVVESYLVSKDRTEISRDPKGLGYLESWELVTPGRRIHMHEPMGGHFSLMDVEQVTKNFIYSMSFYRTNSGKYRLFSLKPRKRGPMFSSGPVDVVAGCHAAEPKLQKLAGEINDILNKDSGSLDKTLTENILEPSCKKEPFDDRLKDILDGIREVFTSDQSWTSKKVSEVQSSKDLKKSVDEQGSYLQCLRFHELDTHASRIEAALAGFVGSQDGDHKRFPWKITCKVENYSSSSKTYGSFTPSYGAWIEGYSDAPIITFVDSKDQSGRVPRRGVGDDSYAKTFFHEMLHYSLLEDGPFLEAAVDCCVPNGDKNACKKLDALVQQVKRTQQVRNQLQKLFNDDQFRTLQEAMRTDYGTAKADLMMEAVTRDIGRVYTDLEKQHQCDFTSKEKITAKCEAMLKEGIQKALNEDLKDDENGSRLRSAILSKFGIKDAAFDSLCVDKSKKSALLQIEDSVARIFSWLFPKAWAGGDEAGRLYCQMAGEQSSGQIDLSLPSSYSSPGLDLGSRSMSPRPGLGESANQIQTLVPAQSELNERAGSGGSSIGGSSSHSHVASDTRRYDQSTSPGPRRTHYSEVPSERAIQIERDLRNERSGVTSYFDRLASKLESVTFPQAAASEMKGSERLSSSERAEAARGAESSTSPGSGGDRQPASQKYDARVPVFDVPDPMQVMRGSGIGQSVAAVSKDGGPGQRGGRRGTSDRQSPKLGPAGAASQGEGPSLGDAPDTGSKSSLQRTGASASAPPSKNRAKAGTPPNGKKSVNGRQPASGADRSAQAWLAHLQKKFSLIKGELKRPSVLKALRRHFIQVIDDKDQVYGSASPKPGHRLTYSKEKDRLVPDDVATGK